MIFNFYQITFLPHYLSVENSVYSLATIVILFGYVLLTELIKRKYLLCRPSPSRALSVSTFDEGTFPRSKNIVSFNSIITLFFETFVQFGKTVNVVNMQTSIGIIRHSLLPTFVLIVLKCLMVFNMTIIKLDL